MDDRYFVDKGAMIAYAAIIQYFNSGETGIPRSECTFTQRFRTYKFFYVLISEKLNLYHNYFI